MLYKICHLVFISEKIQSRKRQVTDKITCKLSEVRSVPKMNTQPLPLYKTSERLKYTTNHSNYKVHIFYQ